MTIKEKVAYLKGLSEGLSIENKEGKLFSTIIDTLCDIAEELDVINENALDIGEELDALSDDLADVEEIMEEMYTGNDDFDFDLDDDDDPDEDDSRDACDCCGREEEFSIDVNCPECGAEIELDDEDLANESVTCPACGKIIELEIDEVDVEE